MSFQTSSLRVAGQDSDIANDSFHYPNVPRCLRDAGLSGKQMYGNTNSINSWIDAINRANKCVLDLDDFDDPNIFQFVTHPFRTYCPRSPFDELGAENDVLFPLDASAWAPQVYASSCDDSDESRSDSDDLDDAQYITIPSDSPWYRLPSPSPGPISACKFDTAVYANSCSSDVRQAIAQQELLLAIFHEELRRAIRPDSGAEYDSDWLEGVDADLVLAPLETYTDLCWELAVCEKSPALWQGRPVPDVPTGFDEVQEAY